MAKGGNWQTDSKGQPAKLRVQMSSSDKKAMNKAMKDKGESKK